MVEKTVPPRRCPRCTAARLGDTAIEIAVAGCRECGGCLLDAQAVETLLLQQQGFTPAFLKELTQHFGGEGLSCPSCRGRMAGVQLRGCMVDLCTACGSMWLDAGELGPISQGRYDNGPRREFWTCQRCGTDNGGARNTCTSCETDRHFTRPPAPEGTRIRVVLSVGAVVTGILSGFPVDAPRDVWFRPLEDIWLIPPIFPHVGVVFSLVLVAAAAWARRWWAMPLMVPATMYAWSAGFWTSQHAFFTAGGRATDPMYRWLAGMTAGALGAALLHLTAAVLAPGLRRASNVGLTVGVGLLAGGLLGVPSPHALFCVWQPAVAYCIAVGLTQERRRRGGQADEV